MANWHKHLTFTYPHCELHIVNGEQEQDFVHQNMDYTKIYDTCMWQTGTNTPYLHTRIVRIVGYTSQTERRSRICLQKHVVQGGEDS